MFLCIISPPVARLTPYLELFLTRAVNVRTECLRILSAIIKVVLH